MTADSRTYSLTAIFLCFGVTSVTTRAANQQHPIQISGIYPHLAVFNHGGECGIGAIVPWAGKLWLTTYPPHDPRGGPDKLYEIDERLRIKARPESVGGTHASRMIHRESNQLIIGPYFVDAEGRARACDVKKLVGRMTATARHLTDPANRVYFFDMEGAIYEVSVHTLAVKRLFRKPVPGWHGKGGYTGQGRFITSNNGERHVGKDAYRDLLVGGPPVDKDEIGCLAEWDGREWGIIERKQFTDVTGPGGIYGAPDDTSAVWSIGWDRRSVILKLLDRGKWHTFRLPKGTRTYDHYGGWYTEWPRIREVAPGELMMDMHGVLYDFPVGFCAGQTGGIRPIATHLRYIPDFCHWNGRLVLAADDTSKTGPTHNPMAGQSQSNLWFGKVSDLDSFGPRSGWGGPWVYDRVKAGTPSEPFLVNGFERRCLHLAVGQPATAGVVRRSTDRFELSALPPELAELTRVTIARGDYHKPAPAFSFTVDRDVVVFIAVDDRPKPNLSDGWERTGMRTVWLQYTDTVYKKTFGKGKVQIPPHDLPHKPDAYGLPHLCFVRPVTAGAAGLKITGLPKSLRGQVAYPEPKTPMPSGTDVAFTIEIDTEGEGKWKKHKSITVPGDGYRYCTLPSSLAAQWARVTVDRGCIATAFFHYASRRHEPEAGKKLFQSLASLRGRSPVCAGLIRPAAHSRNLQFLAQATDGAGNVGEPRYLELNEKMQFSQPGKSRAAEMQKVAAIKRDFEVDAASVIMRHKGRRYRLPKCDSRYDKPFAFGWPRGIRECVSERFLANIHGTFYEIPWEAGVPSIKPVCTHGKQIMDFCTWRGLMVLSGTRVAANPDGQYFASSDGIGLSFGHIDDLWKLGKPRGSGGPWLKTPVEADLPSDPYLMVGYERKRLELSHDADVDIRCSIEVDFSASGAWHTYKTVVLPSGKSVTHVFPTAFSAHWVRLVANKSCRATAVFTYE